MPLQRPRIRNNFIFCVFKFFDIQILTKILKTKDSDNSELSPVKTLWFEIYIKVNFSLFWIITVKIEYLELQS